MLEWYLRAINQFLLSGLWLLLEKNLWYFLIGFFVFYVILLVWDFLVCHASLVKGDRSDIPIVVKYDIWGSVVTVSFISALIVELAYRGKPSYLLPAWLGKQIEMSGILVHDVAMVIIGLCTGAYAVIFWLSFKAMKFPVWKTLLDRSKLA